MYKLMDMGSGEIERDETPVAAYHAEMPDAVRDFALLLPGKPGEAAGRGSVSGRGALLPPDLAICDIESLLQRMSVAGD